MSPSTPEQNEPRCPHLDWFDPLDPAQVADPFTAWGRARHEAPVFFSPVLDAYVVTKYEDVVRVVTDPESFSNAGVLKSFRRPPPEVEAILDRGYQPSRLGAMVVLDPPVHTRVRKLVGRAFSPRRVSQLEGDIRAVADEQIDAMMRGGTAADFVSAFAYPVPLRIILRLLGLPDSDADQLHQWAEQKMAIQGGQMDLDQHMTVARGFVDFQQYVAGVIARRRQHPGGDDLISITVDARDEQGEALDDVTIVGQVMGLVNAGHETVQSLLTLSLHHLLSDRSQWEALCADPSLVPAAVEEALRFHAPIKQLFRTATESAEVGGVEVPEGARVLVAYGSANRDEDVFVDADRFDIRAERAPHLSFSKGIHFCLGASLARAEGQISLLRLCERLPSLRLAPDPGLRFAPNMVASLAKPLMVEWDR